jgi:hypothetical protein
MSRPKKPCLKRCTVCRKWYRPSAKAITIQRTCCEKCRLRRRRRLARIRRERSLQEYRVEERERQRISRQRRKKKEAGSAAMSRTGLLPQVTGISDVVRESVDKVLNRSRATLIRQLTASIADNAANRGQAVPAGSVCHAPACSCNCLSELG